MIRGAVKAQNEWTAKKGEGYGIHADTLLSGSGKNEAHDEQCEESPHHPAGAYAGGPPSGKGSGRTVVCIKGAKYRADGIWEIFAEEAWAFDGTD